MLRGGGAIVIRTHQKPKKHVSPYVHTIYLILITIFPRNDMYAACYRIRRRKIGNETTKLYQAINQGEKITASDHPLSSPNHATQVNQNPSTPWDGNQDQHWCTLKHCSTRNKACLYTLFPPRHNLSERRPLADLLQLPKVLLLQHCWMD